MVYTDNIVSVYLIEEGIDHNGGPEEKLLINIARSGVPWENVMHRAEDSLAKGIRPVEASVEVVQQLVACLQGVLRCLGHLRVTILRPKSRILVFCIDGIVGSTEGIVCTQLVPPTTQLSCGVAVKTANIVANLEKKGTS